MQLISVKSHTANIQRPLVIPHSLVYQGLHSPASAYVASRREMPPQTEAAATILHTGTKNGVRATCGPSGFCHAPATRREMPNFPPV